MFRCPSVPAAARAEQAEGDPSDFEGHDCCAGHGQTTIVHAKITRDNNVKENAKYTNGHDSNNTKNYKDTHENKNTKKQNKGHERKRQQGAQSLTRGSNRTLCTRVSKNNKHKGKQ